MPMNARLLRPLASGRFSPTQISGLAAWHDASDEATVTLDSGRVASWADKSGNGRTMANATSGSTQPDYITAGQNGRNVVRFTAASTQRLSAAATSTYNFLHNGTPCTVMVAIKAGTTSNPQAALNIMGSNAGTGANIGTFISYDDRSSINANLNDAINTFITAGSSITAISTFASAASYKDTFPPNAYTILSLLFDAANGTALDRFGFARNGSPILKANTSTGTPTASNASFALQYGAIGNNSGAFTGDFCEVLMYEKLLSDAERQKVEGYLAWKWGLQGSLPYDHPYAYSFPGLGSQPRPSNAESVDWITRVYANGGTVSTSTANAVDTFCNAIDAAGIRDRFYRLNLFAGDGLNAALVPLYRGPTSGGTQYGNTTDTNNGPFVSADYVETGASGGLKGNGTSKYLATGFASNVFPSASDVHLSVSAADVETTGDVIPLGSFNGNVINLYTIDFAQAGTSRRGTRLGSGTVIGEVSPSATSESHLLGVRRSTTDLETYRAGVSLATSTAAVTPAGSTREFFVYGLNSSGSAAAFTAARLRLYSIGNGMTGVQAADFSDAVDAFNTAMGRT